ncbi:hypothetical protein PC121_g19090 [Phytophthora cactorum]|nr:hypothetical protein PC120_g18961 [Phytophthora cactorum]KAG3049123.1 hypothetical protein PC121_g19090 [Phytophthora cactorum]KAG4041041.1 hypothetical protein PC123_g23430 [Phytophthora cactorum]
MVCYQDVFERAYITDKLTRVGRRVARDPQRPQPVTGSSLIGVHTFSIEELVEEDSNGPVVRSPRMRVALAAGHEVAKKYRRWLQTLALGVSHFAEAAKPAVTMQHLSKMTWTESDHCFLCLKTFRTYRRRHHCRFCGEAVGGNSDSIIAGHRKLDLRMASDGSGRNLGENASPNASRADMEELTESRGCNTCVSELQMNLTVLNYTRSQQDPSSSSVNL